MLEIKDNEVQLLDSSSVCNWAFLISKSQVEKQRMAATISHRSDFSRSGDMEASSFSLCAHSSKLASNGVMKGIRSDSDFSTGREASLPTIEYLTYATMLKKAVFGDSAYILAVMLINLDPVIFPPWRYMDLVTD